MSTQVCIRNNKAHCLRSSGMQFIWRLEDSYEQRHAVKLYLRFLDKRFDEVKQVELYDLCWIKVEKNKSILSQRRTHGKATFVLKSTKRDYEPAYALLGVEGANPFLSLENCERTVLHR